MNVIGKIVKGARIVQDNRKEWIKVDGVCLGELKIFSYSSTSSRDIGAILDKMIKDERVVAVVYNWKTGQAFMKSGVDLENQEDSKINQDYTTFIVSSRIKLSNQQSSGIQSSSGTLTNVPSGFLTRDGENLTLDGKKFISVGSNAYWLGYTESYDYPTKQQVEEMFIAVTRLGGNTIRSHTLGHSSGSPNSLRPYDNNLNEKAWESIDYAFSMAKKYNVKIIAPLTDGYTWYNGNYGHFCTPRGVDKKEFWTNKQVREDFKDYIKNYLNHYNPYNKCFIKDDPSLGMIELGNELGNIREGANSLTIPTYDWLYDISKYIRSIDKKHLILNPADESLGQSNEMGIETLDCHGAHFYWEDYGRLDHGINIVRQVGKPYIVGEYSSFAKEKWFRDLESRNVKASWFWSMYPHKNGIFGGDKIPHNDGYTIHYSEDNKQQLLLIAQHFCRLKGVPEVKDLDFGKYVPEIQQIKTENNAWESGKSYEEGQVVIHKEVSYKCMKFHSSPIEPGTVVWQPVIVPSIPTPIPVIVPSTPNPIQVIVPSTPNPDIVPTSGEWKDGKLYKIKDIVSYKNKTYVCIQEHTSNIGWVPDLTKLILWNENGSGVQIPSPVVVAVKSPTQTPTIVPTPSLPSTTQNQNPTVFGGRLQRLLNGKSPIGTYYQSWSAPWASSGEAHDLSKVSEPINIVYISFCSADPTYTKGSNTFTGTGLQFSSDFSVVKKAIEILRKRGVVVMLSVGGATYPFTNYNAKKVADLCNDLGCNGIDIDWEDEHGFERFGSFISSTRDALPDGCISTAGFSVGAYGEGEFVSSPPASSRTGMNIQGLKSNGHQLDWINIMSYDASNVFNPIESFKAYKIFYKGPLLIGGEVPPEAWGGHVIDLAQVKSEAEFLKTQGPEHGYFTWSYQKQGTPNSKEILDTANNVLKNQVIVVNNPVVVGGHTVVNNPVPIPNQKGKTILAPYCYSWSKWHRGSYKIPTLVDGIKTIGMTSATFAFVTSDGGNNLSATVQENIEDMTEYVKLGGHLIISCGGAMSPWIEATMSIERMVELLGNLLTKTGAKGLDLDVEGTALYNTQDINKLNKAVAQLQKNIPGLYVSYTIPAGDPQWGECIEGPSQNLLKNAIENGVNINVVNLMLMNLYGDYSKRPKWGQLAINTAENAKKTLSNLFPSRSESEIYKTLGLCPMIGKMDDSSIFDVEDAKTLARYAKEKNVGLYTFWAMQRDQSGIVDLNLHSMVNEVDFEFYNSIKNILYS